MKTLNKALIVTIVVVATSSVVLLASDIPRSSVLNTINGVDILGPTYRGEFGVFDEFFMSFKFENSGKASVEITRLDVTILINGSNYNSKMVTHNLGKMDPGENLELQRVVQLSNAPIGWNENQVWNITATTEITAKAEFVFFNSEVSIFETRSFPWEVHLFD